jgi:hypothetical protein
MYLMGPLEVIGGAIVSAKVVEKLLGPTADYIGNGIHEFAKKRVETVQKVFKKGAQKLGDRIDTSGVVPPRILAGVLNEGSYRDDDLSCEYYGGVLASSRTEIPRDDRAAVLLSLVSRLSTYQLRAHYTVYRVFYELFSGSNLLVTDGRNLSKFRTFIPETTFSVAMELGSGEEPNAVLGHVFFWTRERRAY